ncbi:Phospholipase a1 [Thalictrum thalictroides]|uniref:Phospholipase A1 n=1 Tax=Thalictrum thalictroides TaxID=46969 RepID=A0A7J6VBZ8_THATH|nr:Phospholipase a1 [Thalictrum thalictroides]
MSTANIAKRWKELSGFNHWNGLLSPLDNDMRQYLLHYGDLVEATYDTFVREKLSEFAGGSRFGLPDLLKGVGLMKTNHPLMQYKVTKYFYATAGFQLPSAFMQRSMSPTSLFKESNWFGYIAVATDQGKALMGRRDIVVCWRGTLTPLEWVEDFTAGLVNANQILHTNKNPLIHQGFYSVYITANPNSRYNKLNARDQVNQEVKRLAEMYKKEEVSVTVCGHSLGAALATMNAADIRANNIVGPNVSVTSFPYASPRIGNDTWKQCVDAMGVGTNSSLMQNVDVDAGQPILRVLRIVNKLDLVPRSPPAIGFTHVGQRFYIDNSQSPFLQAPFSVAGAHDMEAYLHGIAGTRGTQQEANEALGIEEGVTDGGFDLAGRRDPALVNKYLDGLKPEYMIPANWWCPANKGMIQQANGSYKLMDGSWMLKGSHEESEEPADPDENQETGKELNVNATDMAGNKSS